MSITTSFVNSGACNASAAACAISKTGRWAASWLLLRMPVKRGRPALPDDHWYASESGNEARSCTALVLVAYDAVRRARRLISINIYKTIPRYVLSASRALRPFASRNQISQ